MGIKDNVPDTKTSECVMSHHHAAKAPDKYLLSFYKTLSNNNTWHLYTILHLENTVQTCT